MRRLAFAIVVTAVAAAALAQAPAPAPPPPPPINIHRAEGAIVVDGNLDDPGWKNAAVIDRFYETSPGNNNEPKVKTIVHLTYDDRYLYVLARMYDPAPDSIVSLLSRRDVRTSSDQLKLIIDSYHD